MLMLPEWGNFALMLALCLAVLQSFSGLFSVNLSLTKKSAFAQCILIMLAFLILEQGFISNNFSVRYIAENSNTHLPLFYKITALWGAHEGSLLLWILILSLWTAAVALFSKNLPADIRARVLGIMGLISMGFLCFILLTSDPFIRLLPNTPSEGQDLNVLLQDIGLAFHPPILYMGYVGFSVPFAFVLSALLTGKMEGSFAKWMRPWTLLAWAFLTLGVTAGSWWSYRELGWGGFWFWDPVENASFMPWLAGTALIHSLIINQKRQAFYHWTILLAMSAFGLSLLGTFLVRSGVLISVHAFASDPLRGRFLLEFLCMVMGGALLVYALRARKIEGKIEFGLISRESFLLLNNVLLCVAIVTILLGTLYPLILSVLNLGKISVGPPYFNTLFIPLTFMVLFCMGIGPLCHWGQTSLRSSWKVLKKYFLISFVVSLIFGYWISLAVALAVFAVMAIVHRAWITRKSPMSANRLGMWLAHIGIGVCVIGIAVSQHHSISKEVRMSAGESVTAGQYRFTLTQLEPVQGSNYTGIQGMFAVFKNHEFIAFLKPQSRYYADQQSGMSVVSIDAGLFRDLYVALAEPLDKTHQVWAVRIYDKPFIRWIWAGGILIFLGGLCSASSRKFYV